MIFNDKEALARVNSPLNLLNRLDKKPRSMDLFTNRDNTEGQTKPTQPSGQPFFSLPETPSAIPVEVHTPEVLPATDPPTVDDILDNADGKIRLATAHDKALEVLTASVEMLHSKLDDIKPDRLPSVIAATSKVVEGIRKERSEAAKARSGREVHLHLYTPIQRKLEEYGVIEVGG